ncbi:MAG: trigger factor [Verrucomicrobiota bacterium]
MNILLEDVAPCRKRMKIEIPANRVNDELEQITTDFQKQAKVQGFRPGKTPKAIIEKKFAPEIESELRRSFVPKIFWEAVKTKKLKVVSYPRIEDLHYQKGMSLSFATVVDLAPEFPLPDYKAIKIQKAEPEPITDKGIDEVLEMMTSRFADYKDIEGREVKEDDFVIIDYSATIDGKPLIELAEHAKDLGERKNFWLWIKPDSFLPEFCPQMIGAKIGDTKEIQVIFPKDFDVEPLREKQAVYSVKVHSIRERVMPEINDEFTKKNFEMTVEELKKKIRADLENRQQREQNRAYTRQIIDQLNTMANFDLPESLVRQQTQRLVNDIVMENQHRGISQDMIEENKEKILSSASANAKEHVKIGFILTRIAEEEKIEVTEDELNLEINIMAHRMQMPVKKFAEEINKRGSLYEIEEQILQRKTMEFLLKIALPGK